MQFQEGKQEKTHQTNVNLFSWCIYSHRYYRLWIYTCNAVLLMAVIVFCGVAGKVLMADYKRLLVGGLNLGQPSFIYAYLALLVQSGMCEIVILISMLELSQPPAEALDEKPTHIYSHWFTSCGRSDTNHLQELQLISKWVFAITQS